MYYWMVVIPMITVTKMQISNIPGCVEQPEKDCQILSTSKNQVYFIFISVQFGIRKWVINELTDCGHCA